MAWDDLPPDASVKTSWDAAPPTKEELPQWSDLPGSIIPNAEKVAKGAFDTGMRTIKGIRDLPSDTMDTAGGEWKHLLKGENPLEGITDSPIAQDVKTVGGGLINTAKAIPGQLKDLASKEAWVKRPVENALTGAAIAAPFLGGEGVAAKGAAMAGEEAPLAEAAAGAAKAAEGVEPLVEIPKAAPSEGLPVVQPGAKAGDPHALFAYNDTFGPGGKPRSIYNVFGDPEHPAIKQVGHGSSVTQDRLEAAGIPVTGREPRSVGKWEPIQEPPQTPPPPPKPEPSPAPKDPLADVKNYINSKFGKATAQPGFPEKAARYLQEEARKAGGKDLGFQGLQARQMGEGFKGVEKAEQLIDYARDKGYLKPGLTDIGRRELIKTNMEKSGQQVGAIRDLASQRGAPPLDEMYQSLKQQLTDKYAIKAPAEVKKTLALVQKDMKANPTFSGVADISTDLNKELRNVRSMGRHTGPNTDAADILSRMNNDAIRGRLNPAESKLYTDSLRDFGAHKKLEKVIAGAARKGLTGRGAPGSITNRLMQSLLDRGGYRVAGNVADRMAKSVLKNPGNFKTLPDFFENLVHQSEDVVDESLEHPGMFKGGRVPDDVRGYVGSHGC